jgi:TetR/AcrR family transcriptional regulator, transcriptional repressor for nem operon
VRFACSAVTFPGRFAQLGTWAGLERWAGTLAEFQEQRGGHGGCPMANLIGQLGERNDETRAVLASGFERREACIRAGLAGLVAAGELRSGTDAGWPAASTLASRSGGLILTQARRDPYRLRQALDGALALIRTDRNP